MASLPLHLRDRTSQWPWSLQMLHSSWVSEDSPAAAKTLPSMTLFLPLLIHKTLWCIHRGGFWVPAADSLTCTFGEKYFIKGSRKTWTSSEACEHSAALTLPHWQAPGTVRQAFQQLRHSRLKRWPLLPHASWFDSYFDLKTYYEQYPASCNHQVHIYFPFQQHNHAGTFTFLHCTQVASWSKIMIRKVIPKFRSVRAAIYIKWLYLADNNIMITDKD